MKSMPTIDIHLRGIEQSITSAFIDHFNEIKEYATSVIDASFNKLRKGHLEKVIIQTVETVMTKAIDSQIKEAVEEAVYNYFSTTGKDIILEKIVSTLNK